MNCLTLYESNPGMNKRWGIALATWGGLGYFPKGQGTVASAAAVAIAYGASEAFQVAPAWFGLAALAFLLPAIRSAVISLEHFGRRDPPQVVIDEVVGQWLVVAVVAQDSWQSWLASLLLFRIFDILKPWPIRKLESLPGGVGIVADDAAAGLCAIIVMKVLQYFSVW